MRNYKTKLGCQKQTNNLKGILKIMIRFRTKILSVLLAILMFVTFVPSSVYAAVADAFNTNETYNNSTTGNNDSVKEAYAIGEDISKRTENAKYIRMSDGSYYVAMYDNAVHYQDEDGVWQDIDNTLSDSSAVDSDDITGVATSKGKHTVKFANNSNSSKLVAIKQDKYKISFNLVGANKSKAATVTNPAEHAGDATELEKITVLNKMISSVKYTDILSGVDLEYVVSGNDVKENIIVKEKTETYVYQFDMKLNKLVAEMQADGTIALKDDKSGEVVYTIAMPYMFDADGEYSTAVTYALEQMNNKEYRITVTADAEWINAEGRAFPITIDPPVGVSTSSVTDLDICSTSPSTNFNPSTTMYVGTNWRCYWKTNDLPDLPASAHIISASISLKRNSGDGQYVGAYQVISDWDETLTWNDTISATSQGVMSDTVLDYNYILSSGDNWFSWNITNVVKEWYSDESLNYGIGFKLVSETTASENAIFLSSEYSTEANRPRFTIVYKDIKGIESYWTYGNQNAGFAGTGYVNYATGNLIFGKSLLSTTDSLIPYTPSLVYNSSMAKKPFQYYYAESSYTGTYAPYGFKLSINETIIKKSYTSPDGKSLYMYILSDEDGTEHYFLPVEENGVQSTTKYQDDDGLQLILEISGDIITITDNSKTVRSYNKLPVRPSNEVLDGWYLKSISDAIGNKIVFGFDSAFKAISVSLIPKGSTQIDYLRIVYGANYMPSFIWNERTREAMVFRYSADPTGSIAATSGAVYLRKIEYAHSTTAITADAWASFYQNSASNTNIVVDATATYTYNSDGYLTKAQDDLSKYNIRYTYSNGKVTTIKEYANTTLGQKIGISYYDGYTQIRSSGSDDQYSTADDIITRYIFDAEGRVTSMYSTDTNKTKIYGASAGVYETQDNVKNNLKSTVVVGGSTSNYLLNGGFETSTLSAADNWIAGENIQYTSATMGSLENVGKKNAYFKFTDNSDSSKNYITQYTHLREGEYILSAVFNSLYGENIRLYMKAESLDNSSNVHIEEIPINEYYTSGQPFSHSLNFNASNYNSTGGENFKISFYATAGNISEGNTKVYIDNITLEENISPSNFSMVQYGNFESFPINSSGTKLNKGSEFWTCENTSFTTTSVEEPFGNAFYINGNITQKRSIKQRIYTISDYDRELYEQYDLEYMIATGYDLQKTFIVSGFGKGTSQVHSPKSKFAVRVDVAYYQGIGKSDLIVPYYFEFQNDCVDWQFICGTVDTAENSLVHYVDIACEYSNQPGGTAYFDEISAVESVDDSVVKYEYYANGLLARQITGYYEEIYEYNDKRQITRMANSRSQIVDYVYQSDGVTVDHEIVYNFKRGNLSDYPYWLADPDSAITKTPVTRTNYDYTQYGQMLSSSTFEAVASGNDVVAKSGTEYIISRYTYRMSAGSPIFGTILSETDNLGVVTRYYYDQNNGRLLAVINESDNTGTCYTYDAIGNITSVMPATYESMTEYNEITGAENVEYTYNEANLLESITSESTTYTFSYDGFGKSDSVSIGGNEIVNYEYNSRNGKLKKINYANNFSVRYVYDALDNIKEVWYNDNGTETKAFEYTYTAYGQLAQFDNLLTGKSQVYKYDVDKRLVGYMEFDTDEMSNEFSSSILYNDKSQVSMVSYRMDYGHSTGVSCFNLSYYHSYNNEDGTINYYSVTTDETNGDIDYNYDGFKRLTSKVYDFWLKSDSSVGYTNTVSYTFLNSPWLEERTSSLVETFTSQVGNSSITYTYEYDYSGNVTRITTSDGEEYRYIYDDLGQLVREDNTALDSTYLYTYDNAGNILTKIEYSLTAEGVTPLESGRKSTGPYDYENSAWGDQLTSFNNTDITYDAIGNPLEYYNNEYYWFTWENGRQLATASVGHYTLSFEYNDEGIRTLKTVNGTDHIYHLSNSLVITEEWGNNLIIYLYDTDGSPIGMQYRNTSYAEGAYDTYWFEKNLQGDIVAVYSETGTKLIAYTYDAWGNFSTTYYDNIEEYQTATYNPFRYRGYYYDVELGFYYLNSRYYDPAIGRFITADKLSTVKSTSFDLTDKNLYAYCDNNPVTRKDDGGAFWDTFFDVVSLAFSVAEVVANPTDPMNWVGLVGDAVDLIPFVSGVGEITRVVSTGLDVADTIHDTVKTADKVGDAVETIDGTIDTYKALKKADSSIGKEVHHIVEKRFKPALKNINSTDEMLSIALDHDTHRKFTNAWRQAFKYGTNYSDLDINDIWNAAQKIYANYPELLEAARKTIFN